MKIYFAPLQGFTEAAYRRAHAAICGGVTVYGVPFVRVDGGVVRKKDIRDISANLQLAANLPMTEIPQVIARDAEEFVLAVDAICRAYAERGLVPPVIDLNMGCPYPPQVHKGRGAGLLLHPEQLAGILDTMRRLQAGRGLSFSAKMRLGQTSLDEGLAAMQLMNDAPLEHVTIHARLGCQQYKGEADEDAFARLYAASAHPVICNGDIGSVDDIRRLEEHFPALQGVMIGRGLLARPTLAAEYLAARRGDAPLAEDARDAAARAAALRIHRQVLRDYEETLEGGDAQVLQKILPFWEYLEPLFGHKTVKALRKARNLTEYEALVRNLG